MLYNTTDEFMIDEAAGDVFISVSLSKVLSQQFIVNVRLVSGSASEESL